MYPEPAAADPADVARKLAAAPDLKMPNLEYVLDSDNRVVEMKLEGMTFLRQLRNYLGMVAFNTCC